MKSAMILLGVRYRGIGPRRTPASLGQFFHDSAWIFEIAMATSSFSWRPVRRKVPTSLRVMLSVMAYTYLELLRYCSL